MLLSKARTLLDLPKASERNVRVLEMDSAAAKIACSPGTFYAAKSPNIAVCKHAEHPFIGSAIVEPCCRARLGMCNMRVVCEHR